MPFRFNPFTGTLDIIADLSETISHSDLSDMPDIGGTVSDHDTRYYTETEIDTFFTDGTIDHGNLSGLADDDHTQYSLADGTRAFTGTITTNGSIVVTGTVDGVDIATDVIVRDGSIVFTGDQSMGSNRLTSVATTISDTDATNMEETMFTALCYGG